MAKQDHNLSTGGTDESVPVSQRHLRKLGENKNGMTDPNGAASGPTEKCIGNSKVTY